MPTQDLNVALDGRCPTVSRTMLALVRRLLLGEDLDIVILRKSYRH